MKQTGEFELIERLCRGLPTGPRTILGAGDDCAILAPATRSQLVTIDSMVEGVHFKLEWIKPVELGVRSLEVNLSDIAAMGGRPLACVVNLGIREGLNPAFFERLYQGLGRAAQFAGVDIVGGNITKATQLTITIALLGEVAGHVLRRDAAREGDEIFVTGTLGDAALGWRILAGEVEATGAARKFLVSRFMAPQARLVAGQRLSRIQPVPAAIDISDGLLQDLGHVLERSEKGAELDLEAIPRSRPYLEVAQGAMDPALSGGDDYELLFCLPTGHSPEQLSRQLGIAVTRVGRIVDRKRGLRLRGPDGRLISPKGPRGWDQLGSAAGQGRN